MISKNATVFGISIVLAASTTLLADVLQEFDPNVGTSGDPTGNWMEVEKLDAENTRVTIHFVSDELKPLQFRSLWRSDEWTKIVIEEMERGHPQVLFSFNPFEENQEPGDGTKGEVFLPPNKTRGYLLELNTKSCESIVRCGGTYQLDYQLKEIEGPLVGDFNYDDEVGFADFLILSRHYEEFLFERVSWRNGDANLDGTVDFDDFTILSQNFGATRPPTSVPEPSTKGVLILSVAALACRCKRQGQAS